MLKISIIFGGNSPESGISINSARSIFDILSNINNVKIFLYYVGKDLRVYEILDNSSIYSNTPEDFDNESRQYKVIQFNHMQGDFFIPVIHGEFGESGQLQKILENYSMPFLFSDSKSCSNLFYKNSLKTILEENDLYSWNSFLYNGNENLVKNLLIKHSKIIIKPNNGGSSIDTHCVNNLADAMAILETQKVNYYICEEFHEGLEFSLIMEENWPHCPVIISKKGDIFTYENKYLPSEDSSISYPIFLNFSLVEKIREKAKEVSRIFHIRDCCRMDGFLLNNQEIIFTDFNPIPSFEQNSLFYQSIPQLNIEVFLRILNKALVRNNLPEIFINNNFNRENLPVLMGGNSSEQDVSILSGMNVCTKLYFSKKYNPQAYLLHENFFYKLPNYLIFRHSKKDILFIIDNIDKYNHLLNQIYGKKIIIETYSIENFLKNEKKVFLALHGGIGENGILQKKLQEHNIIFNGANAKFAALFFHKKKTIDTIENFKYKEIDYISRHLIDFNEESWKTIKIDKVYLIKPVEDGCSFGIAKIINIKDLEIYKNFLHSSENFLFLNNMKVLKPKNIFQNFLLEEYIECDHISIASSGLIEMHKKTGYIELTVGFLKHKIFNPSLSILTSNILTLEEKFTAGVGINLTPPPEKILNIDQLNFIKNFFNKLLKDLNFNSYGRIDFLFNREKEKIIILEINTLPALTFSTVLFPQILQEKYNPTEFLEDLLNI
jgi:D-alanine--D-alanine ligase